MTYRIRPDDLASLRSYVEGNHPYPFGDFMTAVLSNDFVGAVGRADDYNREIILDWASYLYNEMPGRSGDSTRDFWGSREAVNARIADQRKALP